MTGIRHVIGLLVCFSLFPISSKALHDKAAGNSGDEGGTYNLQLTTTGEKMMSSGRRGGFRVYAAPDGTEGAVSYARFDSLRDAQREIRNWLKLAQKITSKEQKKDLKGRVTGDRIVAVTREAKSGDEDFLIIRRNDLDCYFIQSHSLPIAKKLETLIE